jgi:hypothetical protein
MDTNSAVNYYANIGIMAQMSWRFFNLELAQQLKTRYGSKIHLYVGSELHAEYYKSMDPENIFSSISITEFESPASLPVVEDEAALIVKATELEKKYGRSFNSLNVTNRHLGRGYALGGYYHPKSFLSENASYAQMIKITAGLIEFWEREISQKDLSLLLNLRGDIGVTVARHHNVPVRNIYESRYKSYNNWAVDGQLTNPLIKKTFDAIDPSTVTPLSSGVEGPPKGHAVARRMLLHNFSLAGMARQAYTITREHLYNYYKGNTAGSYFLGTNLAIILRRHWDGRQHVNGSLPKLKDIGDQPFIFFPLQVEPESSLQGQSPEFLCQLNAIVAISRSLPARYRLVVKEHLSAIGRRPRDFCGQIMALKNVIMMDVRELGKDVVDKAALVTTITGTAGLEAAIVGKPVICFGRHNSYNILPHVRVITDESQIKGCLDEMLSEDFDLEKSAIDGARYLQAVKQASFDLKNYNHLTGKGYEGHEVDECMRKLETSLTDIDDVMIEDALAGYPNENRK